MFRPNDASNQERRGDDGYITSRSVVAGGSLCCLAALAFGLGPLEEVRSEIRSSFPQSGSVFDAADDMEAWLEAKVSGPEAVASQPQESEAACLTALPAVVKAGQLIMPSVRAEDLAPASVSGTAAIFRQSAVGNAIIMSEPKGASAINTFKQTAAVNGQPTFVFVDEEGGSVQRMKAEGELPSQQDVASGMSPAGATQLIAAHAAKLKQAGIDGVFGPVVDVLPKSGKTTLGGEGRMFSTDPAVVSNYAAAYADAWSKAGIMPVLKHFPGHGSATGDTHAGPATTPPFAQLQARDIVPYKNMAAKAGVGVMMGHLSVPGLTETGTPASLSPKATQYARTIMGKETPLFTDSMQMGAVNPGASSQGDLAVQALRAGNDVVVSVFDGSISGSNIQELSGAVTAAIESGALPGAQVNQSLQRVFAAKGVSACSIAAAATTRSAP